MITTLYKRPLVATRAEIQEIRRQITKITLDKNLQKKIFEVIHRDTATEILDLLSKMVKK